MQAGSQIMLARTVRQSQLIRVGNCNLAVGERPLTRRPSACTHPSAAMTTGKIFLAAYGRASAVPRSRSYARAHMSRHRYPSLAGLHAETPSFRIFRLADSIAGSAAIVALRRQSGPGT